MQIRTGVAEIAWHDGSKEKVGIIERLENGVHVRMSFYEQNKRDRDMRNNYGSQETKDRTEPDDPRQD